ncbi:MAG TPA: DUF2905 domain-containing protein [Anaerolineae bacterium]|nr:DUF2905 domain-containing protein [Anaerolineae bacterium]
MANFGRILTIIGITLLLIGIILSIVARIFPNLSNLPGDFSYEGDGFRLWMPFGTMLAISILGTILLNIILRFFK